MAKSALRRRPKPPAIHHLIAATMPVGLPLAGLAIGSGYGFAVAVLAIAAAHIFLVGNVWLALPRPAATVSKTMLGVALEPIRQISVPLALFGVTSVVAAYVGAMVGEKPDIAASFNVVAWFLGAAAVVVVLVAVPYVFWRARALSGKQLRKARLVLAKPVVNPFKRSPAPVDLDALAVRPVGEYALWFATAKGGRNLMWFALTAGAFALKTVSSELGG